MIKKTFYIVCALAILALPVYAQVPIFNHGFDVIPSIAHLMPSNPIVVEAGSFDGKDAIYLSRAIRNSEVHAFEPVPELYQNVKSNTQGFKNIFTYQIALSDTDGKALFYVSESVYAPGVATAASSLLAPGEYLNNIPELAFPRQIIVETITLDTWANQQGISHVDFLWLDMQGTELNMLKGSPRILKTVKAILTEVEYVEGYKDQYLFEDMKKFLEIEGFTLKGISTVNKWYGDALFVRE